MWLTGYGFLNPAGVLILVAELEHEDVAMGISPERESPPPSIPSALQSPTLKNAQPMSRAEQIRQQQAQYRQEHQGSQPSTSASESSRSASSSPPHQATISKVVDDQPEMISRIDEVAEELSDLQLLEKSRMQLQASFWRPAPGFLAAKMHKILEGLQVIMENQEGVYYNH
jgi:hypothetical protein